MRIKQHIDLLQEKINSDQEILENKKVEVTEVID
jgi:hypothetical protein